MSFEVVSRPDRVRVAFSTAAISIENARSAMAGLPEEIECVLDEAGPGKATLDVSGPSAAHAASNLFARINGYPEYPDGLLGEFRNSDRPLVSCILLLPFNDLFARHAILPSIIRNSASHPIEIVIVFAGFGIDREPFQRMTQLDSELTSIAKGYNLGVRHARGEYVALFHDDCFVDDPHWIPKALAPLDDGAAAVTPEFDRWQQVPVAKAVPLVMRRAEFEDVGGYDEYYFVGVEDMDLTVTLLAARREVRCADIRYRHLRGMGTSLIVHQQPHQLKLLFGYQVLPPGVIAHVHRDAMQLLLSNSWIRMLEGDYHLRFLKRHGDFIASRFSVDVPRMVDAYQSMRHPHLLTPQMAYMSNREKLIDAYCALMNAADLSRPIHEESEPF